MRPMNGCIITIYLAPNQSDYGSQSTSAPQLVARGATGGAVGGLSWA
jgi:hypothetical protein